MPKHRKLIFFSMYFPPNSMYFSYAVRALFVNMRKDVKWLVMGTFGVLAAHKTEDRSCVHAQIVTAGLAWAQVCFALSHTWAWLCSPLCDLGMSASGCVLLWDFYKNNPPSHENDPE